MFSIFFFLLSQSQIGEITIRDINIVNISTLSLFQRCHYFNVVIISTLSTFQRCHYFNIVNISTLSLFQRCHHFNVVVISLPLIMKFLVISN